MLAAKLRWENGSAWLQGPPGRPRVVEVEGDGHDDVAAAMKEALLSLGECCEAHHLQDFLGSHCVGLLLEPIAWC